MSSYTVIAYPAEKLPDEYKHVVHARWLRSLRHGNDFFRLVDAEGYYAAYFQHIITMMNRPGATIRMAVLTDDRDVVLGFSVARGSILDYVHVQAAQRRMGIGKSLIPKDIDTITHLTKTGLTIWGSKYGYWKFNPFL